MPTKFPHDPGCELIYLSTGKSDLHVLDVSDPSQPDSCNFFGGGIQPVQGSLGLGRYKQELYLTYICAVIPFLQLDRGEDPVIRCALYLGYRGRRVSSFSLAPIRLPAC
ncbi:MAG: hypothetical protein IPJ00_18600 [Saprospirales bacterium]|nr:hypothetical protein [Saprospirales bacterium]